MGTALFASGSVDPTQNPSLWTLACLQFFLILFAYSAAGYYAGRETQRASTGAVAGIVTFAVYNLLGAIYVPGGGSTGPVTPSKMSALAFFLTNLASLLLFLGIAAGLGWLGGKPGAARGMRQTPAPEEVIASETSGE
jgi:hypothetical protein